MNGSVTAGTLAVSERRSASTEDKRLERVVSVLRFGAAVAVLVFGQELPNLGAMFVLILGTFLGGYGLLVGLTWARVRNAVDRENAARLTLAADISLVGFALFVFAPDPSWTVYVCGFLVIASGGFRFRSGALLAAASLCLTYVVVMVFRVFALGIPMTTAQIALQLGGYVAAGAVLNAVLPGLDAMRERDHETYEPILRAHDDAGDAVLMTEAGRPIFWNKAFEALAGYTSADLRHAPSITELVVTSDDLASRASDDREPFRGQVRTRAGTLIDVEVVRRDTRADDNERSVWLLRDMTARAAAEAALRDKALHDGLTGLPNRTLLGDRLGSAIAVAQRQDAAVSLLLLDLDGFKRVNDTCGHHAGDLVLIETARRLTGALRESDTAARLGGDEFVLLLPATPLVGAIEAARALCDFISAPVIVDGKPLTVGASIGIAIFPDHGRDSATLMAAADSAMYEAKQSGGGYRTFRAHIGSTQP